MATDRELAQAADAALRKTTVTYSDWKRRVDAGKYTPQDGSSTEWGKALNLLRQIGQTAPPPPPPPPPTGFYWREDFTARPASWWQFDSNGPVQWGHPAFTLQPNGEGGTCLRIGSPPNAPGGAGVLGAMWNGSDQAHGMQGEIWMATRFRFSDTFNGWFFEHHENFNRFTNNSIYSPAIGLNNSRRLIAQTTGGPIEPHLGGKPHGTQTTDTQTLSPNRWYTLLEHMILSPSHSTGVHEAWVDGRQLFRHQRGTLLTNGSAVDQLAFGLYAYPFTPTATSWIEFDYLAQGPSRTSVGG